MIKDLLARRLQRFLATLTLFLGIVAVGTAQPIQPGQDVTFIMEFGPNSAQILAYEPIGRLSKTARHRRAKKFEELDRDRLPDRELIVLTFHGQNGDPVDDAFALRGQPLGFRDAAFHKRGIPTRMHTNGGLFSPSRDQRILQVHVPDDAVALLVTRVVPPKESETEGGRGESERDIVPLGLFLSSGARPRNYPPRGALRLPRSLRGVSVSIAERLITTAERAVDLRGLVLNPRLLEQKFRIVVMSDGFLASQEGDFTTRFEALKLSLLGDGSQQNPGTPPFSNVLDESSLISAWISSTYETIDNCPCDNFVISNSLTIGNYQAADYPAYYGTDRLDEVWSRAISSTQLSTEQIDMILIIPNCEEYGGTAYPESDLAFASTVMNQWPSGLGAYASHELGHVIANLGDEYISCVPEGMQPDGTSWWVSDFGNLASHDDFLAQEVPWSTTGPMTIQQCLESFPPELNCPGCPPLPMGSPNHYNSEGRLSNAAGDPVSDLGLFWGAGFIYAAGAVCDCDVYTDPRGCGYYRPTENCRMRDLTGEFCDVCVNLLVPLMQP